MESLALAAFYRCCPTTRRSWAYCLSDKMTITCEEFQQKKKKPKKIIKINICVLNKLPVEALDECVAVAACELHSKKKQ